MLQVNQVNQHLRFMQGQGFQIGDVLKGTRIDRSRLDDQAYLLDLNQFHAVVLNMIRLTGDRGIGLDVGRSTNFDDLGAVGYAMATASTLGQIISLWLQYGLVGFPFTVDLIPEDPAGKWGVSSTRFDLNQNVYRFYIEETIVMGQRFCQLLTGIRVEFAEIHLSYPAPHYYKRYAQQFGRKAEFDAPETRFIMKWPPLSTATKSQDSELRELCIRHCSRLARHIERRGPLSVRLRDYLKARGAIPSLDDAAADLNMSARLLRHNLHKEKTTYQTLLDEFRCDLAQEYLGTKRIRIKEIADLLGFSHVDSFGRAFKSWTGQTPGDFQNVQRKPVP